MDYGRVAVGVLERDCMVVNDELCLEDLNYSEVYIVEHNVHIH